MCTERLTGTVASEVVLLRAHSEGNRAMGLALFWNFTQRRIVVPKHRDGGSSWTALPLKMGPIGCFETSVRNYRYTVRKLSKACRSHLRRGRNLNSPKLNSIFEVLISEFRLRETNAKERRRSSSTALKTRRGPPSNK